MSEEVRVAAAAARRSGPAAMRDGNIPTAGLPEDLDPDTLEEESTEGEGDEGGVENLDDLTVPELKDRLDGLGIEYSSSDHKADLVALLDEAT